MCQTGGNKMQPDRGDLNEKEIQKRGDIHTCVADTLCWYTAENTTLYSDYTPIYIKKKKKKQDGTRMEARISGIC